MNAGKTSPDWTQKLTAFAALAAVGVSLFVAYLSIEANRSLALIIDESEERRHTEDKEWSRRPFLAFATHPEKVEITLDSTGSISPQNGDAQQGMQGVSTLINYGQGPAFDTSVTWEVEKSIDGNRAIAFAQEDNVTAVAPRHIMPGSQAQLTKIPDFILKSDLSAPIEYEGTVEINYRDADRERRHTYQSFRIAIAPDKTGKRVQMSLVFGELQVINHGAGW